MIEEMEIKMRNLLQEVSYLVSILLSSFNPLVGLFWQDARHRL